MKPFSTLWRHPYGCRVAEGRCRSSHHNPFHKVYYILSRTQQGVWWVDNYTALSATSLWDGQEKQWRHLIVPETQSQLPCLYKQLGFRALFRKLILKDEGIKMQEEALKFWNLQYWFQINLGLFFEAWKGNGLWPTVLSPWLGGGNNNNISSSSSEHFYSAFHVPGNVLSTLLTHWILIM